MERILKFPCPNCKKISGGEVTHKEKFSKNKNITKVRIRADCCLIEFEEHYAPFDLHHYGIREIEKSVFTN